MVKLKLKKFDPRTMKDDRISMFCASRGGGKSTLVKNILYHKRHLPMGQVYSTTEESNEAYQAIVPDSFIYGDFSEEGLSRLMERQRKKTVEYNQRGLGEYPNVFVVADDCMADKKIWKSKLVRDIFLNGRHRKVFLLVTVQYLMDMSPDLRENIDYLFVLASESRTTKEKLWRNFFSSIPDFNVFCEILDQCTHDYGCLVLDKTIKSQNITDKIFYYKAEFVPDFKMGCAQFWEYDRLRNRKFAEQVLERRPDDEEATGLQYAQAPRSNRPRITVIHD